MVKSFKVAFGAVIGVCAAVITVGAISKLVSERKNKDDDKVVHDFKKRA